MQKDATEMVCWRRPAFLWISSFIPWQVYLDLKLVPSYKWLMALIWSVWRSVASRWGTEHLQKQKGESSTLGTYMGVWFPSWICGSHPRSVSPTGPNPLCTAAIRIPDLVFGETTRESWNWRKIKIILYFNSRKLFFLPAIIQSGQNFRVFCQWPLLDEPVISTTGSALFGN